MDHFALDRRHAQTETACGRARQYGRSVPGIWFGHGEGRISRDEHENTRRHTPRSSGGDSARYLSPTGRSHVARSCGRSSSASLERGCAAGRAGGPPVGSRYLDRGRIPWAPEPARPLDSGDAGGGGGRDITSAHAAVAHPYGRGDEWHRCQHDAVATSSSVHRHYGSHLSGSASRPDCGSPPRAHAWSLPRVRSLKPRELQRHWSPAAMPRSMRMSTSLLGPLLF